MTTERDTHALKIDSVGDLLAAVPALVGFYPERSVVVLAHDDVTGRIGATARIDLGLTRAGALRADCRRHLAEALRLLRQQGAERLFCVVVDDRSLTKATPAIVQCLEGLLPADDTSDVDIVLIDLIFVPAVAAGARWLCRHGETGRVADPHTSPATLAAALEGRPVRGSRSDLLDLVAEEGEGVLPGECLQAAEIEADGDPSELLSAVLAAVTTQSAGCALSDADVALLGGALLDLDVRDAAMALPLTVVADEARYLFAELARRLRGTPRAAAATLVAASAYVRGDGPLTGIALDAALTADRGYRAARLLMRAFDSGLSPREMTVAAELGLGVARRLGVVLPPQDGEFSMTA